MFGLKLLEEEGPREVYEEEEEEDEESVSPKLMARISRAIRSDPIPSLVWSVPQQLEIVSELGLLGKGCKGSAGDRAGTRVIDDGRNGGCRRSIVHSDEEKNRSSPNSKLKGACSRKRLGISQSSM